MSIYRKIDIKIWDDEKFKELTPLAPSGQALWLYLLSGRHTTAIPGLARIGEAALAEELGWTPKAFREAFEEVFALGMVKADWKARVVWVKNAVKYNLPESPNVVAGWGKHWPFIPDCELKVEAYESLKLAISGVSEAYLKAFEKALSKPIVQPSPNQRTENSEQRTVNNKIEDSDLDFAQSEEKLPEQFEVGIILNTGELYRPTTPQVTEWEKLYPAVAVQQHLRNMAGWSQANPKKRKTKAGILRFVNAWLQREQDRGGNHVTTSRPSYERQQSAAEKGTAWLEAQRNESLRHEAP